MPSALDTRFDAILGAMTGPGGPVAAAPDAQGRLAIATLPATLPGLFDAYCTVHADTVAVIAGEESLTFAELNAAANAAAWGLVATYGIAKGDRVGIAMRNAPAWIVAYMAVLKAGGIATLVNGWWQTHELAHALRLTEPKLVICDAPRAARIAATGLEVATVTLDLEAPIAEAMMPFATDAAAELPPVAPDDDATILFTSGSTGESKGAVSTHRSVTAGAYSYAAGLMVMLQLFTEDKGAPPPHPPRTLVAVPLFHVTGEVPVMLNSFVIGRGMVLMRKWDAGEALRLIEAHRITYFVGVPTMSLEMMVHPDQASRDLSTLTDIAAGGAPRPIAHVKRLQESFPAAQPALGYGLTETNAAGCSNFWTNYADKPASTGRQQPLVQVSIVGADGAKLPPGTRGEIGIRAAANFRGYWRNEAATRAAFTADGTFLTGDIGYLDEDGYLFIVDRKKDIIIRGGENISCQEVEAAIYAHPAVAEASVFGLADERLGEVPGAVVHLEPGETLDHDGLREFLGPRLAAFKLPVAVWFHEEPLPKLGTGKIDKVGLRDRYRVTA